MRLSPQVDLSPEHAFARIGYTMFVFHIVPDKCTHAMGSLTYGQLCGCLREGRITGKEL